MKYIAILLATFVGFVCSTSAQAQTKEETATWIIQQTQGNPHSLKFTIEGDLFISRVEPLGGIGGIAPKIEKAIPIGIVTHITYTHTPKYLSYSLICDKPCAYLLDEPDTKQPKFLFEIYQTLDSSFPPRMNKALLNLVKSHGGNAKIVKQEAQKELY